MSTQAPTHARGDVRRDDAPVRPLDDDDAGAASVAIDGRRARRDRRDRNAEAVLQAAVELLSEGHSHPPGQLIADRAGVSLRTIFRCYPSLDALMKATVQEYVRIRPDCFQWTAPPADASFDERVEHVVRSQSTMCVMAGRALRAGRDRSVNDPDLKAFNRQLREYVIGLMRDVFGPELQMRTPDEQVITLARAHNAIFFESWENGTMLHGLTPAQATEAMRRSLRAAFD